MLLEQCFSNRTPRNPGIPCTVSEVETGVRGQEDGGQELRSPAGRALGLRLHPET